MAVDIVTAYAESASSTQPLRLQTGLSRLLTYSSNPSSEDGSALTQPRLLSFPSCRSCGNRAGSRLPRGFPALRAASQGSCEELRIETKLLDLPSLWRNCSITCEECCVCVCVLLWLFNLRHEAETGTREQQEPRPSSMSFRASGYWIPPA